MKMRFNLKLCQQGFGAVSIILILMILGVILLTGFHQLVNRWQKSIIIERNYYFHFNQASSALSWAMTGYWQIATDRWQCQTESHFQLQACIKKSSLKTDHYILVRGGNDKFYLYQLTHQHGERLQFEEGHWLDHCPEQKSHDCE